MMAMTTNNSISVKPRGAVLSREVLNMSRISEKEWGDHAQHVRTTDQGTSTHQSR
jgi:hypothetical protein